MLLCEYYFIFLYQNYIVSKTTKNFFWEIILELFIKYAKVNLNHYKEKNRKKKLTAFLKVR